MAICALVGIGAMVVFISIGWPGDTSKYPVAVFVFATVGFMAAASIAVFSAARDSFARKEHSKRRPGAD